MGLIKENRVKTKKVFHVDANKNKKHQGIPEEICHYYENGGIKCQIRFEFEKLEEYFNKINQFTSVLETPQDKEKIKDIIYFAYNQGYDIEKHLLKPVNKINKEDVYKIPIIIINNYNENGSKNNIEEILNCEDFDEKFYPQKFSIRTIKNYNKNGELIDTYNYDTNNKLIKHEYFIREDLEENVFMIKQCRESEYSKRIINKISGKLNIKGKYDYIVRYNKDGFPDGKFNFYYDERGNLIREIECLVRILNPEVSDIPPILNYINKVYKYDERDNVVECTSYNIDETIDWFNSYKWIYNYKDNFVEHITFLSEGNIYSHKKIDDIEQNGIPGIIKISSNGYIYYTTAKNYVKKTDVKIEKPENNKESGNLKNVYYKNGLIKETTTIILREVDYQKWTEFSRDDGSVDYVMKYYEYEYY